MAIMASKGVLRASLEVPVPEVVDLVRSVVEEERRSVAVRPPPVDEEVEDVAWTWEEL